MRKLAFPFLLSIVLLNQSCQKETSVDGPTINSTDSIYLSKVVTEVRYSPAKKDSTITNYKFDNLKRVSGSNTQYFDIYSNYSKSDSVIYTYNGTDTLIYKAITVTYKQNTTSETVTDFYTYDANKRIIADSTIDNYIGSGISTDVKKYTYIGNKIYGVGTLTIASGTPVYTSYGASADTCTLDANGNVSLYRRFDGYNYGSGITKALVFETTRTYDNNINPYRKMTNIKVLGLPFNLFSTMQYNNILSENAIDYGGLSIESQLLTNTHTYGANGYLKQTSATNVDQMGYLPPVIQQQTITTHYTYLAL